MRPPFKMHFFGLFLARCICSMLCDTLTYITLENGGSFLRLKIGGKKIMECCYRSLDS